MPPKKRTRKSPKDEVQDPSIEVETANAELVTPEIEASEKETEQKKTKKRKTKSTEPEEPLRMRNLKSVVRIGAHVSMAKSIANSVTNANHIGANSFAMFLKNQRKWVSPDLKPEEVQEFQDRLKLYGYDPAMHILPHGSYLINLAQDDPEKQKQAYDCFLDDLRRCEILGIGRYNFHPGSTASCSRERGIANVASCINRAIEETTTVRIVIENMAGHGNIIGGPLEELAQIIDQVKDKSRVGVCLDTCPGHDLRNQVVYDALMKRFDDIVGFRYLAGLHLNDSKADLGANKDLHQNIGLGYLGLEAFRCIMNDKRLHHLPMVLETPSEDENKKEDKTIWAREIELLEWLVGKQADDAEVLKKSAELQEQGAADRVKASEAAVRKAEKLSTPIKKRKSKAAKEESDTIESDNDSS